MGSGCNGGACLAVGNALCIKTDLETEGAAWLIGNGVARRCFDRISSSESDSVALADGFAFAGFAVCTVFALVH